MVNECSKYSTKKRYTANSWEVAKLSKAGIRLHRDPIFAIIFSNLAGACCSAVRAAEQFVGSCSVIKIKSPTVKSNEKGAVGSCSFFVTVALETL